MGKKGPEKSLKEASESTPQAKKITTESSSIINKPAETGTGMFFFNYLYNLFKSMWNFFLPEKNESQLPTRATPTKDTQTVAVTTVDKKPVTEKTVATAENIQLETKVKQKGKSKEIIDKYKSKYKAKAKDEQEAFLQLGKNIKSVEETKKVRSKLEAAKKSVGNTKTTSKATTSITSTSEALPTVPTSEKPIYDGDHIVILQPAKEITDTKNYPNPTFYSRYQDIKDFSLYFKLLELIAQSDYWKTRDKHENTAKQSISPINFSFFEILMDKKPSIIVTMSGIHPYLRDSVAKAVTTFNKLYNVTCFFVGGISNTNIGDLYTMQLNAGINKDCAKICSETHFYFELRKNKKAGQQIEPLAQHNFQSAGFNDKDKLQFKEIAKCSDSCARIERELKKLLEDSSSSRELSPSRLIIKGDDKRAISKKIKP